MFAQLAIAALASSVAVNAAPVAQRAAPSTWATGYLEPYDTYHLRYLALDCQDKHNTTFFDDCCHPLLATESLAADRPAFCTPNATEVSSASAYIATANATGTAEGDFSSEYSQATSSVESVYQSLTSATPTATVDTTTSVAAEATATTATTTTTDALESALSAQNAYATSSEEPTTSSTPAPAATTPASTGGNVETGGYATYFYQNGNPGACGNWNSDSGMGIAIDIAWYGNTGDVSQYCGKQIAITNTNNGKSVTATVWDVCPTCVNGNSLDLSVGAFTAIASEADGMVPISWQFV